jgi:predicted enzyme related to lactoylglutathione lyase
MADSTGFFVWYELMTTDVAAAKRFYGSVIGWSMDDMPMPGMTYTVAKTGNEQVAGLMTLPADAAAGGMKPCWAGYVTVPDVDQGASQVVSRGGRVFVQPTDIPNIGRFAAVADPQGAMLNLFKGSGTATPVAASMQRGRVGWHELHTSDAERAFDFYQAMFGWTKERTLDMGEMGGYHIFSIGGTTAGGIFKSPSPRPSWLYYFSVDDADASIGRIKEGGGSVTRGPVEVPGGALIVQATDPQGAMFAVVAPPHQK